MPEATPIAKKSDVQFQTYSNREYINYVYSVKYEDCVRSYVKAISDAKIGDLEGLATFRKDLAELYWLVIVPRLAILPPKSLLKSIMEKELDFLAVDTDEGAKILSNVAAYLYDFGTLRPETRVPDPKHILIKKLEQRRQQHGTL